MQIIGTQYNTKKNEKNKEGRMGKKLKRKEIKDALAEIISICCMHRR